MGSTCALRVHSEGRDTNLFLEEGVSEMPFKESDISAEPRKLTRRKSSQGKG